MTVFAVSEEKNRRLAEQMAALGIFEKDIVEKFIRSSGHGGQNLNKTASCVYLRHVPTGIEIKCMEDRSQSVNRFLARRELVERISRLSGRPVERDARKERALKQKLRRKRRSRIKYEPA